MGIRPGFCAVGLSLNDRTRGGKPLGRLEGASLRQIRYRSPAGARHLFFAEFNAYVLTMRAVVLMLCFLCAALSGWTSALGQTQHLTAAQSHSAPAAHAHHDASKVAAHCDDKTCDKAGRSAHPLLCAARYAIS